MTIIDYKPRILTKGHRDFDRYVQGGMTKIDYEISQLRGAKEAGAIAACIENGINLRTDLVETAALVSGASRRYIRIILDELTGDNPKSSLWDYDVPSPRVKKYRLI